MSFFEILTKMDETISKRKNAETLSSGLKRLGSLLLVIGIVSGTVFQLILPLIPQFGPSIIGASPAPPIILIPVIVVILGLISGLFMAFLTWIAARIFGGRGSFGQQFGVSTLILWPTLLFVLFMFLFYSMAFISPIFGIIFLVPLYFLTGALGTLFSYFNVIYLKQVHKLTTFKAAMTVGLSLAFMIIVMLVLAGIFIYPLYTVSGRSGVVLPSVTA